MRSTLFFCIVLLGFSVQSMAQTLGEFKPKDHSFGLNKLKGGKVNRIYISGFDVNYQIYNEKQEYRQGGHVMGGGTRGDALTEISVGLEGLDEQTVQAITDKLYKDYMSKLEAKGLTVITADEAAKTDTYKGFLKLKGGTITTAEIPGVMTSSPTGFQYFVKDVDKDGKTKKGGFLGTESFLYPKLSKELDDAIIGSVDITVLFIQDQEAFQGNGAKLKIKTSLRVIATESVVMTSDAKVKMKGQNSITSVSSNVSFYHGKMGAGSTTQYVGTMGKPLYIGDVLDETSITSFARGGVDSGTKTMYGTFYSVRNANTKNAKILQVDPEKYGNGVYAAASKFLNFHTDEFLKGF